MDKSLIIQNKVLEVWWHRALSTAFFFPDYKSYIKNGTFQKHRIKAHTE